MNRNNRLYGILAAGVLTGLVLAVIVAFSWGQRNEIEAAESAPVTLTLPAEDPPDTVEGLRTENEQLRAALAVYQEREGTYRAQLETANQTILQLQQDSGTRYQEYEDDDEYEEHEDEHEEYEDEHEEHEEEHEYDD